MLPCLCVPGCQQKKQTIKNIVFMVDGPHLVVRILVFAVGGGGGRSPLFGPPSVEPILPQPHVANRCLP